MFGCCGLEGKKRVDIENMTSQELEDNNLRIRDVMKIQACNCPCHTIANFMC
jgi:hypothetical protein